MSLCEAGSKKHLRVMVYEKGVLRFGAGGYGGEGGLAKVEVDGSGSYRSA